MKQQTAVEWLFNWMENNQYFIGNDLLKAIEQAKEMEKQQSLKDIQYALLYLQSKIKKAAELLMGISDTYDINDIEIHLDWMLSTGEIPDEYPKEVMTREYESIIICEVEKTMDKPFG
jgi:hypothetical protein